LYLLVVNNSVFGAGFLYFWTHMSNAVLVYSTINTPRLRYVLQWIFGERLGIAWELTSDYGRWQSFTGARINYSDESAIEGGIWVRPSGLLADNGISGQQLSVNRWKHSTVLFYNQPGASVPFDIFSAVFYLLSRYEEYLPHKKDRHGRYAWQQSAAGQYAFLQQPVADEWVMHLGRILSEKYGLSPAERRVAFLPSYDIDMAWRYLYKGPLRSLGAYAKDVLKIDFRELAKRIAVSVGRASDPFFCFDELDALHDVYHIKPLYFWLLGKHGTFDRNTDPHHPHMQQLIRQIGLRYDIGIHPSYASHTTEGQLEKEIGLLQAITGRVITRSRQHFIKFELPNTYRRLMAAGITDDYSMGYAGINGFRAGTSNSFLWYDLDADEISKLRVHPFAFMDATSRFYNKSSLKEAFREWERLYHAVRKVNGTFSVIWHNYILSNYREYKGWRTLYRQCLDLVTEVGNPQESGQE